MKSKNERTKSLIRVSLTALFLSVFALCVYTNAAASPGFSLEALRSCAPNQQTTEQNAIEVLRPILESQNDYFHINNSPFNFTFESLFPAEEAQGCGLGRVWEEYESGWTGRWTRRGDTNVFDAHWERSGYAPIDNILVININGYNVSVDRRDPNMANNTCSYTGTLAADRVSVSGDYSCNMAGKIYGPYKWNATIGCSGAVTARYIGCFKDQGDPTGTRGRDLNGKVWNSRNMTVQLCAQTCVNAGFNYAGVQYGSWCFCGNSYGKSGTASNCNMPCSGNSKENCGGSWANAVYRVSR